MARRNQYIKSKADYVLRKHHMFTTDGVIYENDKFTIMPEDNPYDDGHIISFSDSNFKFKKNLVPLVQKKIHTGKWISPDNDGVSDYWTAEDCASGVTTTEYKIVLNPDYTTLKSFAYYGSSVELINATIKDIALHYPGGIYFLGDDAEEIKVNGTTYYTVANDFEIDVLATHCSESDVDNPMRILGASYMNYIDPVSKNPISQPSCGDIDSWCPGSIITQVQVNGVSLFVYVDQNGKSLLLSQTKGDKGKPIIVPSPDKFAEMYNGLDDFSKVLLNLSTYPLFTAHFNTSFFTNDGYKYRSERYTFPSLENGEWFTPRLSGGEFERYYTRLIRLAEYHDEYDTFNIWRMMTHESIKNLDWTYTNDINDETESDFDSTRVKTILTLYGRQFDDLKRYTDNIKTVNSVQYDNRNATPDYFLTDFVENDGWDAFMVNPSNDNTIHSDVIYTGTSVCGYTSSDVNINFMKVLALNNNYIKSLKGTKRGLETVLGLFGLKNSEDGSNDVGTYKIDEYVAITSGFPSYGLVKMALEQADDYQDEEYMFDTLPIAIVQLTNDAAESDDKNYCIPWFDKNNEKTKYMYFQMNGGWERVKEKRINLDITALSAVTSIGEVDIYNETVPYMMFVQDTKSLTALTNTQIEDDMICYVYDISDVYGSYVGNDDDNQIIQDTSGVCFSHYFVLKNKNLSTVLGFVRPEDSDGLYNCYGWRNIFTREYEGIIDDEDHQITCDGMKVIYLESIMNYNIGNNPHVGYGHYDDGIEYLEYFNQIFKYRLEHGQFSRLEYDSEYIGEDDVKEIGFGIDYNLLSDNTKCHYFKSGNEIRPVIVNSDLVLGDDGDEDGGDTPQLINIGDEIDDDETETNWNNWNTFYEKLTIPEQEDNTSACDEPASFSVVNVKNMHIDFNTNQNQYLRLYIEDVVLPYIEHMIPSTTIFRYTFDGEESTPTPLVYSFGVGQTTQAAVGDGVVLDGNESLMAEFDVENESILGFVTNNNNMK